MRRLLFITNGNGEIAIAGRLAQDVRALDAEVAIEHVALVGESCSNLMAEVGPRRVMPSGGLIAMGNVGNIVRDVRGGLLALTFAQYRFLRSVRGRYDAIIAVGDVFALLMARLPKAPVTYVGTAKSVLVAPYGLMERRVLRTARDVFVRDEATAQRLRDQGVDAQAPGNVIVDLFARSRDPRAIDALAGFRPAIALFPGSRASAYDDAAFLFDVLARVGDALPSLGAACSIAPMLDVERFAERARASGLSVEPSRDPCMPFVAKRGERVLMRAWRGEIGALLPLVQLVIGQAGTANEAAASAGVPVIAFELGDDRKTAWYRMRQHGLLGDALHVLPGDVQTAAQGVVALLRDEKQRAAMGATGRARMGSPGAAAAIARVIVDHLHR